LTLLHTAIREVEEETGLNIDRFKGVAGTFEIKKPGSEIPIARAYVFLAKLRSASIGHGGQNGEEGEIEVRLNPKEHQAYRWVGTKVEVEELDVIPNVKVVLMDLLEALDDSARVDQK
jgi:8-oxo-dGTP pyrophosphatase MutT (NUDIX family)